MACPKSVRTAAIISQVILVLWILLTILSNVFQNNVIYLLGYRLSDAENIERAFPWTVAAMCIADIVITSADFFICQGKHRIAPLIMTAVTTGILPIADGALSMIQLRFASLTGNDESYIMLHCANSIGAKLSYLLYAAAVITIAAAAVYAYAKKKRDGIPTD